MSDKPLFPLGAIRASENAIAAIEEAGMTMDELLQRHQRNDSDSCSSDRTLNSRAIQAGGHVRSLFNLTDAVTVFIETAGERNVTICVLWPEGN